MTDHDAVDDVQTWGDIQIAASSVQEMFARTQAARDAAVRVDARFCDQHQWPFRTSGCLVCGLMQTANEREALKLQLAQVTTPTEPERAAFLRGVKFGWGLRENALKVPTEADIARAHELNAQFGWEPTSPTAPELTDKAEG